MISPLLGKTGISPKCFTFWYHMYGEVGTLNIYVNSTSAHSRKRLVWSLSGDKGNIWRKGQVNLTTNDSSYQVGVY